MHRFPFKHVSKLLWFVLGACVTLLLFHELRNGSSDAVLGPEAWRLKRSAVVKKDNSPVHHKFISSSQDESSGKFPKDANSEDACQKHMVDFIHANMYSGICMECATKRDRSRGLCQIGSTPICTRYETEGLMRRELFMNIFDEKPPERGNVRDDWGQVTFVSQLSLNRFERIEKVAHHWSGAMSLAIYLTPSELWTLLLFHICSSPILRVRRNIVYHVAFSHGEFYPVNFLRNAALEGVQTPYVFLSDADLIPSTGFDQYLAQKINEGQLEPKTAFVIPAFEMQKLDYGPDTFPRNKSQLLKMEEDGHMQPFLEKFYLPAYQATDYKRWRTANESYDIEYQQEFEPYVVMRKTEVPTYDERLIGRIRDKASHLLHVHVTGVRFIVLHDVYTIHYPHNDRDKMIQVAQEYYKCSVIVFINFLSEMIETYPGYTNEVAKYIHRFDPRKVPRRVSHGRRN